jgi:hypothetical protein
MQQGVNTEGCQGSNVELLSVAWIRLEDDLELVMHLHAIGVLAITTIVGANGWLDESHIPRLRTQDAQGGGRIVCSSANLSVIRLPDQATVISPEVLQGHDDGLEVERKSHGERNSTVIDR